MFIHDEYHDEYLEDLGLPPQRLRVYHVPTDDGYDDEEPTPWQVDAVAVTDGKVAVSAACVNFATWSEAIAYLPALWSELAR